MKNLVLLTSILFLSITAFGQRFFGVATSQWNTINSMYLNPASLGGCNEKITLQLISLNAGVDNSLGTFTGLGNLIKANNDDTGSTSKVFNPNSGKEYFSMLLPTLEIRGPGVLVSINKKMTVAATTRIRFINQLNHFDRSIYDQVTAPEKPTEDFSLSAKNLNWTGHMWSEIGLSFGMVLIDNEKAGQLKAGISLRHLSGVGYIGLKANNMDIRYFSGKDSFYASNADLQFASNLISTKSAFLQGINGSTLFSNLFGSGAGSGFGGDIGVTYTNTLKFGDNSDDGEHRISASVSVIDVGAIKYKKDNHTLHITGNGYLDGRKIRDYEGNIDSIRAYAKRQGFAGDTGSAATKLQMPTALIISGDYQVYKNFYANVTYIANMVDRQMFGNSVYNSFTVTPRFDTRSISVGLPISYSSLAKDMKLGLGLRVGGFVLGSDDMLAFISNKRCGINFYVGASMPIAQKGQKKNKKNKGDASIGDQLR